MEEAGENNMAEISQNIKKLLEKSENIETRLANLEERINTPLKNISKKIEILETSQQFISKTFEGHKKQTENLIKRDTAPKP